MIVTDPITHDLIFFLELLKERDFTSPLEYRAVKSRYISYLTFALNYKLHGLDVTGYHIFNLAIHILNAILVYWLVVLTFRVLKYQRVKVSEYQSSEDSDT
ncbi:MAG: hypothetical protein HY754_06345, partial [Nitrospirae bacterium]|nr:hypothetical protein [Nitrospirota bacterium]